MILGTRGSALALAQTAMVLASLREAFPGETFSHRVIHTTGDLRQDLRLGRPESGADKSVWTKELEAALADGQIDVAIHSAKDVPTVLPPGFRLAGCLPRAAINDVLVARHPGGLESMPIGATVATSSTRRARQLTHHRPDLQVVEIRGNVPTRLLKLSDQPGLDALILARAGLDRLGYATPWLAPRTPVHQPIPEGLHATMLPADQFFPAAAQGIVAFEVLGKNPERDARLAAITDPQAWRALRAEREFLRLLHAGCHTPIGLHSAEIDGSLSLHALVFDDDPLSTAPPRTSHARGPAATPEAVAAAAVAALRPSAD